MRFFRLAFSVLFLSITVLLITGCKEEKKINHQELEYLNKLEAKINNTEIALTSLNATDLQKRIALINTWYLDLKDTAYDIAKKRQIDFNGFKIVYQKYIDNFFKYEAENAVLKEQFKEFKNKVQKESIARKEFKKIYNNLENKANNLLTKTLSITRPVNDLAFSWRRYYKELEAK